MSGANPVVIVGGGISGLACGRLLEKAGVPWILLEATDRAGGRIKTDSKEGFLLDRGFQVFLTAYPEAQRVLHYPSLELKDFYAGALTRVEGRLVRISDPFRNPLQAVQDLSTPVAPVSDLLRVARIRSRVRSGSLKQLFEREERTTREYLREAGFGEALVERFFRPFFGGVFLERELSTSSRMFEFVFRMMAEGSTSLPKEGMESIPRQMTDGIEHRIRFRSPVLSIRDDSVLLEGDEEIPFEQLVLAVDGPSANQLSRSAPSTKWNSTTCLYYAVETPPYAEPILTLGGDEDGPINNLCIPSNVSPLYAPPGASLISVSVVGSREEDEDALNQRVLDQAANWFGPQVRKWRLLNIYHIPRALPRQTVGWREELPATADPSSPILCGDYTENGSIQGALLSGKRTAKEVLRRLS